MTIDIRMLSREKRAASSKPRNSGNHVRSPVVVAGVWYFANRYPHEFSGGQRQRIGIVRALEPRLIVCDEPISALDVSIRAQVINLLEELQGELGLTYLFIAHDLAVVRHISDRVAVMYVGKMMEVADRNSLYERPLHPYTQALLSAIPVPDPIQERKRTRVILRGDVPSPVNLPTGCRFNPRCRYAEANCTTDEPPLIQVDANHTMACHYWQEIEQGTKRVTQAEAAVVVAA